MLLSVIMISNLMAILLQSLSLGRWPVTQFRCRLSRAGGNLETERQERHGQEAEFHDGAGEMLSRFTLAPR